MKTPRFGQVVRLSVWARILLRPFVPLPVAVSVLLRPVPHAPALVSLQAFTHARRGSSLAVT